MLRKRQKPVIAEPWVFPAFSLYLPTENHTLIQLDDAQDEKPAIDGPFSLLKLTDLEPLHYGPLEDNVSQPESITDESRNDRDIEDQSVDIWAAAPFERYDAPFKPQCWAYFENKGHQEPSLYLSETQEDVWNAVWQKHDQTLDEKRKKIALKQSYVLRPLIDLGLGYSSAICTFTPNGTASINGDLTFSSLSADLTSSLVVRIADCGKAFRVLTTSTTPTNLSSSKSRAWAALCSGINRIVAAIQTHVSKRSRQIRSILQVQDLFSKPAELLHKLQSLIESFNPKQDDVQIVNHLILAIEVNESADISYHGLLLQLLALAASPLLVDLSHLIGLSYSSIAYHDRAELSRLRAILDADSRKESGCFSALFDSQQESLISDIYQGLKLLQPHAPEHVLHCGHANQITAKPQLELGTNMHDIARIQNKVDLYRKDLRAALSRTGMAHTDMSPPVGPEEFRTTSFDPFSTDLELLEYNIAESLLKSDGLDRTVALDDRLALAVQHILSNEAKNESSINLQPPFEVLRLESFTPLLHFQSGAVDRGCLQMIIKDHHLRHNLEVLYNFNLLGSGMFATKLKQALFSSDMASAERKKGHQRFGTQGLRLESRTKWPPAGAELRLSLMGILKTSYQASFPVETAESQEIPGGLAFSIRHLSESEIEACMDSTSLAALDFLRLQYRPPGALGAIITEQSLEKYDRIFRLLLRLSRVAYAVDTMWTSSRDKRMVVDPAMSRFKFMARHFVQTLVSYIHTRIAISWQQLCHMLAVVEAKLDDHNESAGSVNLTQLRTFHDMMLNQILSDTLLQKQQRNLMQTLENILTCVLHQATTTGEDQRQSMTQFYTHTDLFVSLCRNLSERPEEMAGENAQLSAELMKFWMSDSRRSGGDGLQTLILALDMNGWYARRAVQVDI